MSKVENESIVLEKKSSGIANKVLDLFEKVGNKLPDSATIFVILCFSILVISYFCNIFNVTALHPITKESIVVLSPSFMRSPAMTIFF